MCGVAGSIYDVQPQDDLSFGVGTIILDYKSWSLDTICTWVRMASYSQLIHRQEWLQQSDSDIRIHYVEARPPGAQKGIILLIHGFPESSYQFRHVMGPLSAAGYRVIAPDYRGAGYSSRPPTGYTKKDLAVGISSQINQVAFKQRISAVGM
ncbi:MAG: hypothetical protein Q9177_002459 [Variospora cf. flavescens]